MNAELVIENFISLPENLQQQVADYIEFLSSRYKKEITKKNEQEELSPEMKRMLMERQEEYHKNPQNVVTWDEIEEKFEKKYGYEI
jgi:hypothetical protein